MKGVIFNVIEEVVTDTYGHDAWEALIDGAGVGGAYTSLGSYPDEEVVALVTTASAMLDKDAASVLRWLGRSALPRLQQRYPGFFAPHTHARAFVLSVNDIIHPEVRKLYAGAGCPHFLFDTDAEGRLVLGYRSPRQLCQLAHGFLEGAGDHYGEATDVSHLSCMHHGDAMCRIAATWQ